MFLDQRFIQSSPSVRWFFWVHSPSWNHLLSSLGAEIFFFKGCWTWIKHCKSVKLTLHHNIKLSFWALSFVFLSFCLFYLFVPLSFFFFFLLCFFFFFFLLYFFSFCLWVHQHSLQVSRNALSSKFLKWQSVSQWVTKGSFRAASAARKQKMLQKLVSYFRSPDRSNLLVLTSLIFGASVLKFHSQFGINVRFAIPTSGGKR